MNPLDDFFLTSPLVIFVIKRALCVGYCRQNLHCLLSQIKYPTALTIQQPNHQLISLSYDGNFFRAILEPSKHSSYHRNINASVLDDMDF